MRRIDKGQKKIKGYIFRIERIPGFGSDVYVFKHMNGNLTWDTRAKNKNEAIKKAKKEIKHNGTKRFRNPIDPAF